MCRVHIHAKTDETPRSSRSLVVQTTITVEVLVAPGCIPDGSETTESSTTLQVVVRMCGTVAKGVVDLFH